MVSKENESKKDTKIDNPENEPRIGVFVCEC